jgi:hypothetical protein
MEFLTYATVWMSLGDIVLREMSQPQRVLFSSKMDIEESDLCIEAQNGGCQGLGRGEMWF